MRWVEIRRNDRRDASLEPWAAFVRYFNVKQIREFQQHDASLFGVDGSSFSLFGGLSDSKIRDKGHPRLSEGIMDAMSVTAYSVLENCV